MKIHSITIRILAVMLVLFTVNDSLSAQKRKRAGKAPASTSVQSSESTPKRVKTNATITVTDEQGNPIADADVLSSRLRYTYTTGKDGSVNATFMVGDMIKIKAVGYEPRTIPLVDVRDRAVQLTAMPLFTDDSSSIETVFGQTDKRRTVGTYSVVKGEDMETTPSMYLMDALGGRLNGLFTMDNNGEPGAVTSTDFVRNDMRGYTIMVDGVERNIRILEPEAIESVTLLKDATMKSLYGGVNSNGIIMIRTKRGIPYENKVSINFQTGVQTPTRLPGYLNAYDYADEFNKVLAASGRQPYFTPEAYLDPDRDQVLYPDVDYYKQFLRRAMPITRMNGQFQGGSKNTRYFAHLGYQRNGGLENYTDYRTSDEIMTVRGNVENTIKDFITLSVGFSGGLETGKSPFGPATGDTRPVFSSQFFNALSDNRPNEFPIFIPGERVGLPYLDNVLGGRSANTNNPYGMLTRTGYTTADNTYVETKFAIDIDLNRWVPGLKIRPSIAFDFYSLLSIKTGGTYAVFEPMADGSFTSIGSDKKVSNQSREKANPASQRNQVFSTVIDYNRTWGDHSLSALGVFYQQRRIHARSLDQMKRLNTGVMANYMYKNRYVVEASLNSVGIGSFAPSERYRFLPAAGLGWVVSEENFMQGTQWMDFLKVRASYGIMGSTNYDMNGIFSSNLYRDRWATGTGAAGSAYGPGSYNLPVYPSITGNPELRFQLSHELNAGIEFLAFDKALWATFGYYSNKITGLFSDMAAVTPGVLGGGAALPMMNYGTRVASGWEGEANYTVKKSDWKIIVGGNFSYGKVDIKQVAELDYPAGYEGLAAGKRLGDIRGMKVIGTFVDQADIDSSPMQQFGQVLPGDLKFADINGDGYVNDKDRVTVGNSTPSWQYGITLGIGWKGINLDLLGYGLAGFQQNLSGNKYYQIYGTRKYSNAVRDGLPNGNPLPALRLENSANNFKNSDWWMADGGFFKLRSAELGYMLPHRITAKFGVNSLKIFARGFNLFTVSKIKDLDPESLTAGVTGYPLMRTFTGGISLTF